MINIGHSPILLKNILLWLWHEVSLSREDVEALIEEKAEVKGKIDLYAWVSDPNRAHWELWQACVIGLSKILRDYGMDINNFDTVESYTPENLTKLRESSGLSLDEFADIADIPTKDLLVFESNSSINRKGISYLKYVGFIEKFSLEGSSDGMLVDFAL